MLSFIFPSYLSSHKGIHKENLFLRLPLIVLVLPLTSRSLETLRQLQDPMMVTGKDEEGNMILRKAKYSDIVILLRSMKTNAEVIQKELMNAGIPAFANNQKGYFDTVEIRTLLSLLSVVDNIYMSWHPVTAQAIPMLSLILQLS